MGQMLLTIIQIYKVCVLGNVTAPSPPRPPLALRRASFQWKYHHRNLCIGFLNSVCQGLDKTSHPTATSLLLLSPYGQLMLFSGEKPHEDRVLLNPHLFPSPLWLFSSSGALFLSLANSERSRGINQTHCSSGRVLGFAPDWVMVVDVEPSGSQRSGLAGSCWRLVEASKKKKQGC